MGSRLFRSTLAIALLCMLVPVLVVGLTSTALTNRFSREAFQQERTQQLALLAESCDLLLGECTYIYYQVLLDEQTLRALGEGLARPMPYAQLQRLRTLMHTLDLIARSRPLMHSILLYDENPLGLAISSRDGLVQLGITTERSWYEHYKQRDPAERFSAVTRTVQSSGTFLSFFMPTSFALRREGVLVFNYTLSGLEALLPNDGTRWMVLDDGGELLFASGDAEWMTDTLRDEILRMSPGDAIYPSEEPAAVLYQARSGSYGWRYINIVDRGMINGSAPYINRTVAVVTALSAVVSVLITAWLTRIAVRQETTQRKLRLREAEMLALQAQINPHFLYNTLELVNWRAIKALGEANSISHIITTLGDLLRYALEHPGDLVPLWREVEHASRYADLMCFRLGSIFSVSWNIDDGLKGAPVPKLMLQPLLENAIQHGIQPRGEGGLVTARAAYAAEDGMMTLSVADNGIGMTPDMLEALRKQLSSLDGPLYAHIGLANVYQRVRLTFADRASISIESSQDIGTHITLTIPIVSGPY